MDDLDDESVIDIATQAIEGLPLPDDIKKTLHVLQGQISFAYQRAYLEMTATLKLQASALARMQTTLELLVSKIDPEASLTIPAPIRVVEDRNDADISTPMVVADPIAAGYVMTQADLAKALRLTQPCVSVLVKAFRLRDDSGCAVAVRRGNNPASETWNYHSRAVERFQQLLNEPPAWEMEHDQKTAVRRARRDLGLPTLPGF